MKHVAAILICCLTGSRSFAAEEASLPAKNELDGKVVATALQRIPDRVGEQLVFVKVSGDKNDWTGYYKWPGPGGAAERYSLAVRVQSYDSAEAADQGFKMANVMISVGWTRQEDLRGLRLYVWDTTMGSGEMLLRVGPAVLFRLDNEVIYVSLLDKTAGKDFLMKVVEAVSEELKTARK
jgi:hypothetical protein